MAYKRPENSPCAGEREKAHPACRSEPTFKLNQQEKGKTMQFLKKLFGTTADGQAEALTYEQLAQKMTEAKLNVADLSTGEYVAKAKYDAKVEELKGISAQLGDANKAIEGFKAMDLEGIQKSADEWKQKYEQETANLKSQMEH